MKVENDELVIYGNREKGEMNHQDEELNCDMDFRIIFKFEDDEFVPYFKIDKKYPSKKTTNNQDLWCGSSISDFLNKACPLTELQRQIVILMKQAKIEIVACAAMIRILKTKQQQKKMLNFLQENPTATYEQMQLQLKEIFKK